MTQTQSCAVRDTSRFETMSYAQSRLWILDQYLDDSTTCNIVVQYAIQGSLDVPRFVRALDNVILHHPSLRTCFFADEHTGEPNQTVLRTPLPSSSLRRLHASNEQDIDFEFESLRNHRWDLAYGDNFAATLFSTDREDEHFSTFGYHHIVINGRSWLTILRDLERAYIAQPLSRQKKLCIDASVEQRQAVRLGVIV